MPRPICATTIPTSPRGTIPRPIFKTFCQPSEMAPKPQPTSLVTIAAARITSARAIVERERNTAKFRWSPMPARKNGTSSSLTPRVKVRTSARTEDGQNLFHRGGAPYGHDHGECGGESGDQGNVEEVNPAAGCAADN